MKKEILHFYIIPFLLIVLFSGAKSQPVDPSSDENSAVDLIVELRIDPTPEEALIPSADSTILICLYKDAVTNDGTYRKEILLFDTSKTVMQAAFDSIPIGTYSLKFRFPRFSIESHTELIELKSDSIFTVKLKPDTVYEVMISADPREYSLYLGYLKGDQKEASQYSPAGSSDVFLGTVKFTILGGGKWKIRLNSAKIDKRFGKNSFPYKTKRYKPFNWIKVEKVDEPN